MSKPQPSSTRSQPTEEELEGENPREREDLIPRAIKDIALKSLKLGGLTGAGGLLIGSFAGVIRSKTPALFAIATGIQWFTLGSTFTASRGIVLHVWDEHKYELTSRDRIYASTIAGAASGTAGGVLRGPNNVVPGAIMFAIFGASGQAIFNRVDAVAESRAVEEAPKPKSSWMESKWSPMKKLSDEEYGSMLSEKVLAIDADIAIIDEKIEALKALEKQETQALETKSPKVELGK